MKTPIKIYVGYDSREHDAYRVCEHSLLQFNNDDFSVNVIPLKHHELRHKGLFERRWIIDEEGQYWDELDGKPFSTEFSHTRFAVQELATKTYNQTGWTMFVDCDFLFRNSVERLFKLTDDKYAMTCVKFDWTPTKTKKMDNKIQTAYDKKLWSSLMLWNLDHPSNEAMGYYKLNQGWGLDLHQFNWLKDEEIGELPLSWNYVPGVTKQLANVDAVHFSEGGPWFKGYENVEYGNEWNEYKSSNNL